MPFAAVSRVLRTVLAHAALVPAGVALAIAGPALAGPMSIDVESSLNPSTYGQKVTFTARLDGGGPTGSVTFKDGSKTLGTGTLSLLDATTSLGIMANHTCALTAAGGVECWGVNTYGQLGNGNMGVNATTPVPVVGLESGIVAISVGFYNSCALTGTGTVKCWGRNQFGQLADGTTNDSDEPVDIPGLPDDITAVSVGGSHICALTDGGAAWCWGSNNAGQVGNGTVVDVPVPVTVQGLSSGVATIAAGFGHTCAITETGAAKCWGSNGDGKLGDGTTTPRQTPVDVIGLPGPVSVISLQQNHTCAVTQAGAAWCWGYGGEGELGNGANGNSASPVPVSGLGAGVATIEVGWAHTCAATEAGAAFCWGYNNAGQLGDGNAPAQANTPQAVSGLSNVVTLAAGQYHTCAVTAAGAVMCWGDNANGKLGDGKNPTDSDTPVQIAGFGAGAALVPARAELKTRDVRGGKRPITVHYGGDSGNDPSVSPALTQVVRKGKSKTKAAVRPREPDTETHIRLRVRVKAVSPARGRPAGKLTVRDGSRKIGTFKVRRGRANVRLGTLDQGRHALKMLFRGNRDWKRSRVKKTVTVTANGSDTTRPSF
ncbi:chromosome condensation regulator RCC1 [Microbaculum marinisediminis]|uniref:Chromosome condensation regulator RCC1 n=1 Tax=Microbaculum marinisediminis TaxID=2931392 RepID=A0AAW5QY74_9HYPH|nr:chromosome condensation regulator RCC1 [Microbaculum sp. A6E488]MCT8972663.1 chromosome condensation regulator RCC1 [Microbaculum sp. A6E488]